MLFPLDGVTPPTEDGAVGPTLALVCIAGVRGVVQENLIAEAECSLQSNYGPAGVAGWAAVEMEPSRSVTRSSHFKCLLSSLKAQ